MYYDILVYQHIQIHDHLANSHLLSNKFIIRINSNSSLKLIDIYFISLINYLNNLFIDLQFKYNWHTLKSNINKYCLYSQANLLSLTVFNQLKISDSQRVCIFITIEFISSFKDHRILLTNAVEFGHPSVARKYPGKGEIVTC